MKRSSIPAVAGVGVGVLVPVFALSAPAFADDTARIVEGLSNSNVYAGSQLVKPSSELINAYSNSNVAIVYVNDGTNTAGIASSVLQQTNYDAVLVTSNGAVFGAASNKADVVTFAEMVNGGGGEAYLIANASEVQGVAAGETQLSASTETNTNTGAAAGGIGLVGGAGIALGAALIVTVGILFAKRLLGRKTGVKQSKKILANEYYMNISKDLGKQVSILRNLIEKHNENDLPLSAERLIQVDKRLGDLFTRLSRKGTQEQVNIAAIKYQDLLKKIIFIMNEDHYMDVSLNPELWNRAEMRKQNSLEAVEAVDTQILDNIKQLNDSQDLDFNITLRALTMDSNNMSGIEELLFKNDETDNFRSFGK